MPIIVIPIVIISLAVIIFVGTLIGWVEQHTLIVVKCPIHGTRYPKDTECPDCMKEQDAAMEDKLQDE